MIARCRPALVIICADCTRAHRTEYLRAQGPNMTLGQQCGVERRDELLVKLIEARTLADALSLAHPSSRTDGSSD